jgi:hypothetical protein
MRVRGLAERIGVEPTRAEARELSGLLPYQLGDLSENSAAPGCVVLIAEGRRNGGLPSRVRPGKLLIAMKPHWRHALRVIRREAEHRVARFNERFLASGRRVVSNRNPIASHERFAATLTSESEQRCQVER